MKQIEELKLCLDTDFLKRIKAVKVDGELYVSIEDVNLIFEQVVWSKTMQEIADVINKNSMGNACIEIKEKYNNLIISQKTNKEGQND